MKKIFPFIVLWGCVQTFALPRYELGYRLTGNASTMLEDGKVDQFIRRPVLGGSFAVEFLPSGRWHCLQQWNNASIGVGVSYLNLGNNDFLGSAVAAYGYMNMPFYNGTHFRIGARPTVGLAAVSKTYANTLPDEYPLYSIAQKDGKYLANWSIGSILNAYLALELYMDFPIKDGWEITINGGWRHISNGSVMHPNAGYNMLGGELGIRYIPHKADTLLRHAPKPSKQFREEVEKPWTVEISVTGGMKQNYYCDNYPKMQFYGVATLKAAAYWMPVAIFRIGAGIDAFYDGYYVAVNSQFAAMNPEGTPITYFGKTYLKESNVKNCFRVGVSLQPEFVIGNLTAGIHIGFYVFDPVKNLEPFSTVTDPNAKGYDLNALHPGDEPFNRGIFYSYDFTKASNYQDGWCYMQFVLKYHILDHLFVQLGLKTHGARAEFIDAGLGVSF